jgi:hypothetical protein
MPLSFLKEMEGDAGSPSFQFVLVSTFEPFNGFSQKFMNMKP